MSLIFITALTLAGSIVYASVGEWFLHLRVMHHSFWGFNYPYKAHALIHHKLFRADQTYHLTRNEDKCKIRMAWWNGPVLVLIGITPIVLGSIPFLIAGWWTEALVICATSTVAFTGYYGVYESLHWCMHLPKERRVEMSWIFQRLNAHHILHHRYWHKNLNVVCPLADLLFGTLLLRSRISFPQVRGVGVPDVQPI